MKKFVVAMIVLVVIGAIIAGIGCAITFSKYGSGAFGKEINYTEHVFDSEQPFSTVSFDLRYSHKVSFVHGENYSVKYFDAEDFPITVSSQNGTLYLSEKRDTWHWWETFFFTKFITTDIVITVPEDVVLTLGGHFAGAVDVSLPAWEFGNITLEMSGATNIEGLGVKTGNLSFDISGSSKIELAGDLGSIKVDASGASELDFSGSAQSVSLTASGSSKVDCEDFSCPSIIASVSGSVKLELEGTGDVLEVKSSGSAKIEAKEFDLRRASFDGSGSMKAEVSVSEYLYVKASGSSTVKYWGNPQVDTPSLSGSSSVKKMG